MKNKKTNIKQQKKYIKRRIALVCILVLLAIILILNISSKRNLNKVALDENALLNVGGESLDLSQVISKDPNPPHLGAGMIPIKWNGSNWVITTATDKEWYDYSKGNWATVMLSDGIYSSELERDKKLASNFVGASIARPEELGTIFTWIPRLAYSDTDVEFLKDLSLLEYNWTTESCFNLEGYGANYIDLAFKGIWVGETEFANAQDLENKNNEMNSKENVQGLIANEKVQTLTDSDRVAVEKLYQKTVGVGVPDDPNNQLILHNIETMKYRQTIKIVNTNNRMPIMAKHIMLGDRIKITDKYSAYGIKFITDKDGNRLEKGQTPIDENSTSYTFYLVDNIGNIRKYTMNYGTGKPNLKGFNKNTTYYVAYDSNGNASSEIPIGEVEPQNWYDYENQRWANIVVRDNGNTNYYVWIPRYMYTLDDENQKVNAKFVDLNNVWTDTEHGGKQVDLNRSEYKLPEAFTWEDPNDENNKIQLPGFWISKYELRDGATTMPEIYGGFGSIRISNIQEATNDNYICEMYLIKDGKRIMLDKNSNTYIQGVTPITLEGNYEYTNLETGKYAVNIIIKDKETGLQINAVTKEVSVADRSNLNEPNLDGFNKAHTYYVVYDEFGNEDSSIPIGNQETPPSNWYEYGFSRWANIVVRENGNENYYVWIPRYQYNLNDTEQKTNVVFTKNDTADDGYQIPEAFTWEDPNDANNKIQLPGFWISKYELRDASTYNPNIYGIGGTINIEGIVSRYGIGNKYYAYLISTDGKILKNAEFTEDYKFDNITPGNYIVNVIVKDSTEKHIAGISQDVTVIEKVMAYPPDVSEYNKNTTFYVAKDELGNDVSDKLLIKEEPSNWYNYEEKESAIVVVREKGYETYYEWVPRYQCYATDKNKISYIKTDKTTPDTGYEIPSEFTDSNGNQLKGYWKQIKKQEILIKANVVSNETEIRITNIVLPTGTTNAIVKLTKNGEIVKEAEELTDSNYTYSDLEMGNYEITIIAYKDKAMIGLYTRDVLLLKIDVSPNLEKFNKSHTYYVVYDEFGNEDSSQPIGNQAPPDNWYSYDNNRWANVVVRENGNENYYVWIPRYEYKINEPDQKTDVIFISTSKDTADDGYKIPEAFTWEDPNDANNKIQLPGFWISKYELRDAVTAPPDIYGTGETITINGIATNSSYKYYAYVISTEGKIIHQKEITSEDNKITNVAQGNYIVNVITKDSTGKHIGATSRDILVLGKTQSYPPDLSSYNINTTFYVNYDVLGKEGENTIPISMQMSDWPENWYNYENDEFKKATVLVREKDTEIYYEWIPRYECPEGSATQRTYISIDKTEPDVGFIIPSEFTDSEGNALKGYWSKKTTYTNRISANIIAGEDTITINNINSTSNAIGTYIYLIQNGEIIKQDCAPLDSEYTFSGLEKGAYTVLLIKKSTAGLLTEAGMTQDVTVTAVEEPNLDGFNPARTYYVTYNEEGNEILTPLSSGIDKNKWYNYPDHRWANILVKDTLEDGTEVKNYFVWIPRYEYTTNNSTQKTIVRFIPSTQEMADRGYKIPESFTWEDPNDSSKKIQLKGFWISKYELRG